MGASKLGSVFWIVVLLAVGAVFIFRNQISDYFSPRVQKLENAALNAAVQEIKKQFSAPPPLRAPVARLPAKSASVSGAQLTLSGTIKWTNTQRKNNGLPALSENDQLDTIASLRLKDMFDKQYFAHISPLGQGAETTAKDVGYDFIALGENLALGDFESDEKLVEAWMNSPGHRENILNSHYTEIGVAVKKGIFSAEGGSASGGGGNSVWIAVQIFGKPISACPLVDKTLKAKIDLSETQLQELQKTLDSLKSEIDSSERGGGHQYNAKVDEYNSLVNQYNNLLVQTKATIGVFNSQVSALNACIAQ